MIRTHHICKLVLVFLVSVSCKRAPKPRRVPIPQYIKSPREIKDILKEHKVIPDVVKTSPRHVMQVLYSNGFMAQLGNKLEGKLELWTLPTIVNWPHNPDSFYTLALLDPDAPNVKEPYWRCWRNWLVVNIRGNKTSQGKLITNYIMPCIPEISDPHRVVFIAYKQPTYLEFEEDISQENMDGTTRQNFSVQNFADKYRMGSPVAINFFYVPHFWDL